MSQLLNHEDSVTSRHFDFCYSFLLMLSVQPSNDQRHICFSICFWFLIHFLSHINDNNNNILFFFFRLFFFCKCASCSAYRGRAYSFFFFLMGYAPPSAPGGGGI